MVGGQAINLPDKSRLEKELKDAHERMLNLSRATSDAIWEWDMQSGQIFRNETLMEMIGYQFDNSRGLIMVAASYSSGRPQPVGR